jgi:hypothetical protein
MADKGLLRFDTLGAARITQKALVKPVQEVPEAALVAIAARDRQQEAVAQGLSAFRQNDWVADLGQGQTTVTVVVKNPEVEHKVRVQDFERWLDSQGRTPAEVVLKNRLRELLGREVASTPSGAKTLNRNDGRPKT